MILPFFFLSHNILIGGNTDFRESVWPPRMGMAAYISGGEIVFWIWGAGRGLDEVKQLAGSPHLYTYFRDPWNKVRGT